MTDSDPCEPRVRLMLDWEITDARLVFADTLNYDRIRVHECASWTDVMNQIGSRLKGMPPPTNHNAITIGYHCYFPVNFPETPVPLGDPLSNLMPWLIHELTHAWQYQHSGWSYLINALMAQARWGSKVYDFGGAAGLAAARGGGKQFASFNVEQQGDIARSYYDNKRAGNDVSAWIPFIEEIQQAA